MKTRIIDGIEVQSSSGNVFADLELPNAEKLKIKSGLVIEITKAMLRGDFSNLSERKLMDCLNRLGYDVDFLIRPASRAQRGTTQVKLKTYGSNDAISK